MAELFNPEQYRQQMSGGYPAPAPDGSQSMHSQTGPQPYQPQHMPQTQMQQSPVQPQPYQPQEWAPQPHQPQQPYAAQPHMRPPHTPVHHMPVAPVFAPPPGAGVVLSEEPPKASRFKRKRKAKEKTPKVKKTKGEGAEAVHTTKTSPAIIFMFGMATGIVCFLVGNMLMSNLLTDNSAKSFREIERQNAAAQQPVLPKSAKNTEG